MAMNQFASEYELIGAIEIDVGKVRIKTRIIVRIGAQQQRTLAVEAELEARNDPGVLEIESVG